MVTAYTAELVLRPGHLWQDLALGTEWSALQESDSEHESESESEAPKKKSKHNDKDKDIYVLGGITVDDDLDHIEKYSV